MNGLLLSTYVAQSQDLFLQLAAAAFGGCSPAHQFDGGTCAAASHISANDKFDLTVAESSQPLP